MERSRERKYGCEVRGLQGHADNLVFLFHDCVYTRAGASSPRPRCDCVWSLYCVIMLSFFCSTCRFVVTPSVLSLEVWKFVLSTFLFAFIVCFYCNFSYF